MKWRVGCLMLLAVACAWGQDVVVSGLEERVPGVLRSLEALDPTSPMGYIELGEEIASEARSEAEYRLAQRLYVLGAALSRSVQGRDTLAASACVALADITRSETDRRSLWALAGSLDERYAMRDWSRTVDPQVSDDVAYAAAAAIGNVRSGQGHLAREVLRRADVQSLIRAYGAILTGSANQDPLPELEREAAKWPCPECRNERAVTRRVSGTVSTVLCNTCLGNPGMKFASPEQFAAQLRFEARVLNGKQRSWGAQIEMDQGTPFRDMDLATLAARFGVDVTQTRYIGGAWRTEEEAVKVEAGVESDGNDVEMEPPGENGSD